MNLQITITKEGERYLAGIPGAYQASATTPLQAMRKWMHASGIYVQRYKHLEITQAELAQRLGITEAEAMEMQPCSVSLSTSYSFKENESHFCNTTIFGTARSQRRPALGASGLLKTLEYYQFFMGWCKLP